MKEKEEELLLKEISQIEELLGLVKRQEQAVLEESQVDRLTSFLKEGEEKAEKLEELHKKVELLLTDSVNQKKIKERDHLLRELSHFAQRVEDLIKEEMDKIKGELSLLSRIGTFKKQSKRSRSYFIDKRR